MVRAPPRKSCRCRHPTILADRIRPGSGLIFRPLLAGKTRTPCHVRRCLREGVTRDKSHPAHTEREKSCQSEDAQREQPRKPGEGNALNPGIRPEALTGRWHLSGRRKITRAFDWRRTAAPLAEIVKRAHRSS